MLCPSLFIHEKKKLCLIDESVCKTQSCTRLNKKVKREKYGIEILNPILNIEISIMSRKHFHFVALVPSCWWWKIHIWMDILFIVKEWWQLNQIRIENQPWIFSVGKQPKRREPTRDEFLVADTQLYRRLCPSVHPSVRDIRVEIFYYVAVLIVCVCLWVSSVGWAKV